MKHTRLCNWLIVCVFAPAPFIGLAVQAGTIAVAKQEKSCTGIVNAIDPKEHVLKVETWLFSKSFNLGDTCAFKLLDTRSGSASDLHAGQKVSVRYQDVHGVLVADRVEQQPMRVEGTVTALDADHHTMTLHVPGVSRKFQIPSSCKVTLRDDKTGTLADVQPGHYVTVTYETPNDTPTAVEIAQTSASFSGALTAIDLTDRTVKLDAIFGSKKFHLADGCAIVLNGRTDAAMRDLKPGDKLVISYDAVNGINVANRIASTTAPAASMAAASK